MSRDYSYLGDNQFAKGQKPNITSFKKGHIPWNKGLKGLHQSPKTEFKKGNKPFQWKSVKTLTKRKDKSGTIRQWIKIKEPNVWLEYAKYLWIRAGKKLKKGFCLHHLNNNSSDDRIENLILVSRIEHPRLHNRWNTKNRRI